jgi:dTDP-4-dehydrorhamnose 3,5-epimerase
MKFHSLSIPDIVLIKPTLLNDDRGYFSEIFRQDLLEKKLGYKVSFVQDNESKSTKGVLRGLHYQVPPFSQSKLVRVLYGRIIDVAVDLRKSSPSFGKHVVEELSDANNRQIFIPHGFAHGFIVLSDTAVVSYKVDNYYSKEHERGILYNDKNLNIEWNFDLKKIIVSDKDKSLPVLIEAFKFK